MRSETRAMLGETVGHIRVTDFLGEGGMGAVYVGFDDTLERRVALKAIRGDIRLNPESKARFLREARILSKLDHPGVCTVHDFIGGGDSDYLVMELVEGRNLRQAMASGLDDRDRRSIARQLLDVLVEVHAQGVLHRDLKPENIMVTPQGGVKVLDFGLSRLSEDGLSLNTKETLGPEAQPDHEIEASETGESSYVKTKLGSILGTAGYMSPEQARGESATPASDMYSTGLILQELFTGGRPFEEGLETSVLLQRAAKGETRSVEGLPADLTTLINRLKSLAPGARPSSVDALRQFEWIADKPRRQRRRAAVIAAGVVLTLMCAALGWQWIRAERNASAAEEETRTANFNLAQALLEKSKRSAETNDWRETLLFSAGSVLHQAKAGRMLPMDVQQPGPMQRWRFDTLAQLDTRIVAADFDPHNGRCVVATGDNTVLLFERSNAAVSASARRGDRESASSTFSDPLVVFQATTTVGGEAVAVALDASGRFLAVSSVKHEQTILRLWKLPEIEFAGESITEGAQYTDISFGHNGRHLAGVGDQGQGSVLAVWKTRPFEKVWQQAQPPNVRPSIALNPVSDEMAAGRWDGTICVSETTKLGTDEWTESCFQAHESGVRSLVYSPDGRHLASSSYSYQVVRPGLAASIASSWKEYPSIFASSLDIQKLFKDVPADLKLWNSGSFEALRAVTFDVAVFRLRFDRQGRRLLALRTDGARESDELLVWDTADFSLDSHIRQNGEPIRSADFSTDSDTVHFACTGGTLRSARQETGNRVIRLESGAPVVHLSFDRRGRTLSSGHSLGDATIRKWDLPAFSPIPHEPGVDLPARMVSVAPDGNHAVVLTQERLTVIDSSTRSTKDVGTADAYDSLFPTIIKISPQSDRFAIAGCSRRALQESVGCFVDVFDIHDGSLVGRCDEIKSLVVYPQFSPDGATLFLIGTGSNAFTLDEGSYFIDSDERLIAWDIDSDNVTNTVYIGETVGRAALNGDGTRVAVPRRSGYPILILDTSTFEVVDSLVVDHGEVKLLAFSSNDRRLITVNDHDPWSIHIWDIDSNSKIATLRTTPDPTVVEDRVTCLAIDAEQSLLAAGSESGSIDIWDLSYLWLGLAFPFEESGARNLLRAVERETLLRLVGADTNPPLPSIDLVYDELATYLELRRFGRREHASSRIRSFVDSLNGNQWVIPIARYFAGEIDEAEVFEAARSPNPQTERERLCQAHYYLGMIKLLEGDEAAAQRHFEASVATGVEDFSEYEQSQQRLNEMGDAESE